MDAFARFAQERLPSGLISHLGAIYMMQAIESSISNLGATDLQTLYDRFPAEVPPPGHPVIERIYAELPIILEQYEALKLVQEKQMATLNDVKKLRRLARDIFWAWEKGGPLLVEIFGPEKTTALLEFLALYRESLWDSEHLEYFNHLPNRMKVFRGGVGTLEDVKNGWSWYLNRSFAEMNMGKSPQGILISATISKKDLLMCNASVSEVVPRIGAVRNIKQIS